MKKWIALLLILCMTAAMLAGCGNDAPVDVIDPPAEPDVPVVEEEPSDFDEPTAPPQEPTAPPQEPVAPSQKPDDVQPPIVPEFNKCQVLEYEGVKVYLTDIVVQDDYSNGGPSQFGSAIQIQIENTTEFDVVYEIDALVINGISVARFYDIEIPAGETLKRYWEIRGLHRMGIQEIVDVGFIGQHLRMNGQEVCPDSTTIHFSDNAYEIDLSGDVVYEGNGITVLYQGLYADDPILYPRLLVINDTGLEIMVQWLDLTINGQLQENHWITVIQPDQMYLMTPEFLVPGHFDSLDSLGFYLRVTDEDDSTGNPELFETEMLEITFN